MNYQRLLGKYPKIGGQSRITYPVVLFVKFMKIILMKTNFLLILMCKKKHCNSNIIFIEKRSLGSVLVKNSPKKFLKMWKIT